jgi:polyisoprenoid-binding protein YceI
MVAFVASASGAAPPGAPASPSAPATSAPAARALEFVIDTKVSQLGFTITRPGETVEGRAPTWSGRVRLDPAHPDAGAGVTLEIDPATMVTGNRIRDHNMKSGHLEVDQYPKIAFRSTALHTPADPWRPGETRKCDLDGVLDLHGVQRPLKIPLTVRYDEGSVTADGATAFTLTEFGIPIPKIFWIVLDDKVTVTFHAVAKSAP